ncbi:MAG TPA: GFA family protein [Dongiaceae bacterium]|nr:GFA family protein [Dongiaceae bacterium]
MPTREAHCCCGQLRLTCEGEPVRIAICHCVDCQRRTGSVFGVTARFPRAQVTKIDGRSTTFRRVADSGNGITFHFCPDCGTTVYWEPARFPDTIAVAVGAFADPGFPAPRHSVYERRRHPWVDTSIAPEHLD